MPPRSGFTLLELLVVIAIIGVLLGLLLPAVQRVRQTAARAACLVRLSQLGKALANHHDTAGTFPPGAAVRSRRPYLTWNAHLLPFLEQGNLAREVDAAFVKDPSFLHVPPHAHRATVVPAFSCPADGRTASVSTKLGNLRVAFTAYAGVAGLTSPGKEGVLFTDSKVRFGDITDGASNTAVAGDRPPSADERLGWWYAGWGTDGEGSVEAVLGVAEVNPWESTCWAGPYRFGPGRIDNPCDVFHFWSLHPGGGNFLMADGSARFLAYPSYPVLAALATRAGGEAGTSLD